MVEEDNQHLSSCGCASLARLETIQAVLFLKNSLQELQIEQNQLNWREITDEDLPSRFDEVVRFGHEWVDVTAVDALCNVFRPRSADEWADMGYYWFRPLSLPFDAVRSANRKKRSKSLSE